MAKSDQIARPDLTEVTTGKELRRWYWLRAELADGCRHHGLSVTGGKFELLDRIAHYLDTGEVRGPAKRTAKSKFNWHSAQLTPETVITDSYRNSQNVRRFFKAHIGPQFKFHIAFMDWMIGAAGETLADDVAEYNRMAAEGERAAIRDHNQFNQYTRDFLADNPTASPADVRRVWARKRALPSETGRHVYDPSDLDL